MPEKAFLTEKDLHDYQKFCVDFVEGKPQCALFLDCGLGKTVIALTAISHLLYDSFEVSRVLIVAPLRVARDTWIAELDKWEHLQGLRMERVIGTEKDRVAALSRRAELYVINRENVEWLVKHYAGRRLPFDMLVIDELSSFKNSKAKRFVALKRVLGQFTRVVGLTGTPAPNEYRPICKECEAKAKRAAKEAEKAASLPVPPEVSGIGIKDGQTAHISLGLPDDPAMFEQMIALLQHAQDAYIVSFRSTIAQYRPSMISEDHTNMIMEMIDNIANDTEEILNTHLMEVVEK